MSNAQYVVQQMSKGEPFAFWHPVPKGDECPDWRPGDYLYGPYGTSCERCGKHGDGPVYSFHLRNEYLILEALKGYHE